MARTAQVNGTALVGMMTVAMAMVVAASGAAADDCVTLEKAAYGPYGAQALVVANSPGAWRQQMKALEDAGALAVLPAPEPPADVDWNNEVVVLVAAGSTGYDVSLTASKMGNGRTKVDAAYAPLGNDGGESLPYHLVKLPKTAYLQDRVATGMTVSSQLPMVGDAPTPVGGTTWGALKANYR